MEKDLRGENGNDKFNYVQKYVLWIKKCLDVHQVGICMVVYENANLMKFVIQANIFHLLNIEVTD